MKRALLLFLWACGGASSGAKSAEGGPCLPVAPMQLLVLEHGTEWEAVSTLGGDGLVSQFVNERDPSAAFRLAGDRLLDSSGVTKATCTPDHALRLQGGTLALRFDADDALVDAEGTRIYVADSTFVEVRHGTTIAVHEGVWRVAGMTPATRRTAELLVLATMASVDWHFH